MMIKIELELTETEARCILDALEAQEDWIRDELMPHDGHDDSHRSRRLRSKSLWKIACLGKLIEHIKHSGIITKAFGIGD